MFHVERISQRREHRRSAPRDRCVMGCCDNHCFTRLPEYFVIAGIEKRVAGEVHGVSTVSLHDRVRLVMGKCWHGSCSSYAARVVTSATSWMLPLVFNAFWETMGTLALLRFVAKALCYTLEPRVKLRLVTESPL